MRRIRTAAIATLGCKLNQSESDQMARHLADAGVEIIPFGQPADLCIINSCTVTHIGDRKSRHLIRQAVRANPDAFVTVTGCYAEIEPAAIHRIAGVSAVIGNAGKGRLLEALREQGLAFGMGEWESGGVGAPEPASPTRPLSHSPAPRTRAFVKIQEGCDNRCSYCIVPQARGKGHSLAQAAILGEIERLVDEGYQEVVLTGVNITAYGRDHDSPDARDASRGMGLVRLLETILERTAIPRVRLTSLQPEDWNPHFYGLWTTGRLCRHLHLSLQSGSDGVLRRMRRRYNTAHYSRIVEEARAQITGVAITTDVIAGFPGETDAEYAETEAFLRSTQLADLHVFKYSPRAGTPAAEMPDQVEPRIKQERSERLIFLAEEMSRRFRSGFQGDILGVLWEEQLTATQAARLGLAPADGRIPWSGISDNYVRVYATGPATLHSTISGALIGPVTGDGVRAALVRV